MTYTPIISSSRISKGYGYTAGGDTSSAKSAVTEKYDDVANIWNVKQPLILARDGLGGFSLNSYGYTAGGLTDTVVNNVEKYDNILNTWTNKQSMNSTRRYLTSLSLNGYGYTIGGYSNVATIEKYDDVLNTWTNKTSVNNGRSYLASFTITGYGYVAGGYIGVNATDITEKYDDILNTWTIKKVMTTTIAGMQGFLLNGYGYTAGGNTTTGVTGGDTNITEKYDDISNIWVTIANINLIRRNVSNFSLNGYGYTAGGFLVANVEKYDDILNTWTTKANLNTARASPTAFTISNLKQSIQNPDIQEIIKYSNKECIPVDQTASRAINGTVYTNTASSNIFITVSARCIIDTAADVANIQAFSDTAADPTTAVTGIIGIEGGLLGEDISIQSSFIVRPYHKYKVVTTVSAGCSATLGKWFETILK